MTDLDRIRAICRSCRFKGASDQLTPDCVFICGGGCPYETEITLIAGNSDGLDVIEYIGYAIIKVVDIEPTGFCINCWCFGDK